MFWAYVFIAIGLAVLLNTLGILNGTFWGIFWAVFFLAIGIKMLKHEGKCPMCGWGYWSEKFHQKVRGPAGSQAETKNENE